MAIRAPTPRRRYVRAIEPEAVKLVQPNQVQGAKKQRNGKGTDYPYARGNRQFPTDPLLRCVKPGFLCGKTDTTVPQMFNDGLGCSGPLTIANRLIEERGAGSASHSAK